MSKVREPDEPPPGDGVKTMTWAEPDAAMSVAGIAAVRSVLDWNVVGRSALFHRTTDVPTKPVPVTLRTKSGLPAMTLAGGEAGDDGARSIRRVEAIHAAVVVDDVDLARLVLAEAGDREVGRAGAGTPPQASPESPRRDRRGSCRRRK